MAFNIKNLARISAGPNAGNNVINYYTYFSATDTSTEVLALGYFNNASDILHQNDVIQICAAGTNPVGGASGARKIYVADVTAGVVKTDTNLLMGSDIVGSVTNGQFATIPIMYNTRYGPGESWIITSKIQFLVIDAWLFSSAAGGTGAAVHITKNSGAATLVEFATTPTVVNTRQATTLVHDTVVNIGDTIEVAYPATQDMALGRLFILGAKSIIV